MGEAKRRKAQDPNYGRPVRGLIMTSAIVPHGNGLTVAGGIDPHQLRYALLFWDKLVWPTNNLMHAAGDQDTEFLETTRILERPRYTFAGGPISAEPFVRTQLEEFRKRDGTDNGIWDLCQNTSILLSSAGEAIDSKGLGLELIEAIPVPDKEVPLNEILEFKRKRNDEFVALRAELDNLGSALNSAENPALELKRTIDQIDKACADTLRICSEWQFPVRLSNQKMALDLKPFEVLAGGVAASFLASAASMSMTKTVLAGMGGAIAGARSAFKITGDIGLQGIRRRRSPFAYVAHAHRELF